MPYLEAKFSAKLNDTQKDDLQKKLIETVSSAFAKPEQYIMINIEDGKTLYLGANKLPNGAYLSLRLLGDVSKSACQNATKEICRILQHDLDIDGADIYITYHPVDLWGWNGSMF